MQMSLWTKMMFESASTHWIREYRVHIAGGVPQRTVRSILIELEALLTDPDELHNPNLGTMAEAKAIADSTTCSQCGHSQENIWPPFPQDLSVKRQTTNFRKHLYPILPGPIKTKAPETLHVKQENLKSLAQLQEFPTQSSKFQLDRGNNVRNANLQEVFNAGLFGRLPMELIQIILFQCFSPKDVCKLGSTCRFLRVYAVDSCFWKTIFRRDFPNSEIAPSSRQDWLDGYIQEANHSGTLPKCSVLGITWQEDILGMPAFCTKNPPARYFEQVLVDYEPISGKAYFWSQKTSINCTSNAWCPLYISRAHFIRHRDMFESTLGVLGSDGSSLKPAYDPWLSLAVLARAMDTSVTVLMDRGIHPSENALAAFYALHRLMLAIVDEYSPSLKNLDQNLSALIGNSWEKSEDVPSISVLGFLASISQKCLQNYKIYMESLQREWHRKLLSDFINKHPVLVTNYLGNSHTTADEDDRFVRKFLKVTLLQRRVRAFQFYFLDFLIEKGGLENVRFQTDRLYGRAPIHWVQRLQKFIRQVFSTGSLLPAESITRMRNYYKSWGIDLNPRRQRLSRLIRQQIPRLVLNANVSDVLLCGESYSSPPKLHNIRLTQTWRWDPRVSGLGNVLYLDATCWVFDFHNQHLGTIDFRSPGGIIVEGNGNNLNEGGIYDPEISGWLGIHHSGDILRPEIFWGQHEIEVDMDTVSGQSDVKVLLFCASSWSSPLPEFKAAEVNLVSTTHWEERGGGTLYSNTFKDLKHPETDAEANSSQVLCALWRRDFGAPWEIRKFEGFGSGGLISTALQNLKADMVLALEALK